MIKKSRISNKLAEYRKKSEMSVQQLAEAVNVSDKTIIAIEKHCYEPSGVLMLQIVKVLNLTVEQVFSLVEEK